MTRREMRLAEQGYSTREIDEQAEFERNAPWGSHYGNALAFIVDSLSDTEGGITLDMIETLDPDSAMEFCEMYNTTLEELRKAIEAFRIASNNYNN